MTLFIFHLRKRLPRLGGNSFYRDNRVRVSETICGAPCTAYDQAWNAKPKAWARDDGQQFFPCQACLFQTTHRGGQRP